MHQFDVNRELTTILESITDAVFALDHQWRFTYLNTEAERILFRKREGLLGKNVWEEFPAAVDLVFYREYHRAVEDQVTVEFEEYFPPLETWFEVRAYPYENGLAVYFQNINRRKRMEEELRRSEEHLRAVLVQYGSDIITVVDAEGTITYESPASERVLGYKSEELIGTNAFNRIHPEDLERARREFSETLNGPVVGRRIEVRFRHADGSWRYFEVLPNNLLDDPDIRGVVINSRDITDRKEAERLLQERSRAIEASVDGVAVVGAEGRYTYVNQAHARVYGHNNPAEMLGQSWRALYDADQLDRLDRHAMPRLKNEGYWRGEVIGRRRDGSTFPQELSLSRLDEGKIVCVIRDITWRKATERRLAWLASFPELNPSPVVEADPSGQVTYANPAAEQLFPDIRDLGTNHPLLADYEGLDAKLRNSPEDILSDEVRVGDYFYYRAVSRTPEDLYRVHFLDITRRRQTEEDLRTSQSSLYEAQRVANIGNWEYYPREDRASWSDQIYRIFGLPPREETPHYREFIKAIHPTDRRMLHGLFQESLRHRKPQDKDFRITRADGEVRWVNAQYAMVYDGEATRAVGTLHDITGRKQTEDALRLSEASLAEAQRIARVGNWEASQISRRSARSGQNMRWSEEFYRIFGFAPREITPTFDAIIEATHPDDRERVGRAVRDATMKKEPLLKLEHRVLHSDGEVRTVQAQIETRYDASSGRPVTRFGTVLDITEFKQAEETQAQLASIVESSQDAILSKALDGTVESWNSGTERLYGYSAKEVVGQHISILAPPDLPNDALEVLRRVSRGDTVERRETVRMKKNGERIEVSLTVSPIRDPSGSVTGASSIERDITGRKALERELEHQAFHDTLTDLPNRALFENRLRHALDRLDRRGEYVALLFMDLDDFKVVNDSLGHLVGDQLLVAAARRLESVLRSEDTVVRFSGDEFVILLEGAERARETTRVAERVIESLRAPFDLGDEEVTTTASIGVSYGFSSQDEAEELLRQADVAMYEAKAGGKGGGKGGYCVFEPEMGVRVEERQAACSSRRWAFG